jgi:hypothetical protein
LFDEATAMEKFTKWSQEHDSNMARRQGAHKKARNDRRDVPVVKKVAEKVPDAPVASPEESSLAAQASEETKTGE